MAIVGFKFPHKPEKREVRTSGPRGLTPLETPKVPVVSHHTILFHLLCLSPLFGLALVIGLSPFFGWFLSTKSAVAGAIGFPIAWSFIALCLYYPFAALKDRKIALYINRQALKQLKPGAEVSAPVVGKRGKPNFWVRTTVVGMVGLAGSWFLSLNFISMFWGTVIFAALTLLGPSVIVSKWMKRKLFEYHMVKFRKISES